MKRQKRKSTRETAKIQHRGELSPWRSSKGKRRKKASWLVYFPTSRAGRNISTLQLSFL